MHRGVLHGMLHRNVLICMLHRRVLHRMLHRGVLRVAHACLRASGRRAVQRSAHTTRA